MNVLCSINIYDIYNFLSINHNKISKKENFFTIKQTLRMQNENVIINNFN